MRIFGAVLAHESYGTIKRMPRGVPLFPLFRFVVPVGALVLAASAKAAPVDEASPMLGTAGHGHAFPGATMPFGMVQLSPDTPPEDWDHCSGYHYSDDIILGFSHTHLSGTGVGCMGDIMVMPTVGNGPLTPESYRSHFTHAKEAAKPGYYRVFLDDPKVNVELTATERAGLHRYTFPASDRSGIVVDLVHGVQNGVREGKLTVENDTTLSGYRTSDGWGGRRTVYFVMKFSRPFQSVEIQNGGQAVPTGTKESTGKLIARAIYATKANEPIEVKVGISPTGVEGARKNLNAEIPGWDFAQVRRKATAAWAKALSVAKVESKDPKIRGTFYSNVYLSMVAPNLFNDVDGTYLGMDHKVHTDAKHPTYSTFSLWDTYRALHPLMTVLQPGRVDGMVDSLVRGYAQYGQHTTPVWPLWGNETWCMIGYHSAPVIVDAFFKGHRGYDVEAAYQAIKDTALQDRSGLRDYKSLGYVTVRRGDQSVSKTLEYGVDDWCIARMAEALGHKDDAKLFYQRAGNYRNLFDRTSEFFRGRRADGTWRQPFDTLGLVGDDYTEANAWGYAFAVQQDVPGMIDLYGGDRGFTQKMDRMFTMDSTVHSSIPDISGMVGQYAQGNEQCHHVAYLYDYAGQPWKTQMRVRQVMAKYFSNAPDGHCGNVDCGQMAAWFVFSALGFYPVNPANGVYALGSPVVDKAAINVPGGKSFKVVAVGNSPQNVYVQSVSLNGKPLARTWITHEEIMRGGELRFTMGPKPNQGWGAAVTARPPSTMPAGFQYAELPTPAEDKPVQLSLPIRVVAGGDEAVGGFVVDPNMVDGATNHNDVPVDTSAPNAGPEEIYRSERYGKDFTFRFQVPKGKAYTVRLHFAEVFGDSPGQRLENISINGRQVLGNFDPIVAAGGPQKAVVKEFTGIQPDADGTISVRVQAAPNSPDQNAKISAIEILD